MQREKRRNTEQYTSSRFFFQMKMKQWGKTENSELKANNTESLRDRRKM
jgi:hypothetical protein